MTLVDLQYEPTTPPELLYHGTATRFQDSISRKGLQKMGLHDLHLVADASVAPKVVSRHGKPVLLVIRAADMHSDGEGWLTTHPDRELILIRAGTGSDHSNPSRA